MNRIVVLLAAAFALAAPDNAAAEVINLTFSGTITDYSGTWTGGYPQSPSGMAFAVTVSYNPNAAPNPASPHDYPFLSSSLSIGGTTLATRATVPGAISVFDNLDGRDQVFLSVALDENRYTSGSWYYATLFDDTQTALTSSRLPASISLEHFQVAGMALAIKTPDEDGPFSLLSGTITDVSVTNVPAAPEPSSLVLLASAGTGLLGMAWRRSRRVPSS